MMNNARIMMLCLLVIITGWLFYIALLLRVDYYDAYEILNNEKKKENYAKFKYKSLGRVEEHVPSPEDDLE